MDGDDIWRTPRGADFDGKAVLAEVSRLTANVEELRKRLAGAALTAAQKPVLEEGVEGLRKAVDELGQTVAEYEVKELFGEDNSYWTVFRLLCAEKNRGQVFSLGEIWDHLSLTYDMNAETPHTLAAALEEWEEFIAPDASKKFKVNGGLEHVGDDGYTFVEFLPRPKRKPVQSTPQNTDRVVIPKLPADAKEEGIVVADEIKEKSTDNFDVLLRAIGTVMAGSESVVTKSVTCDLAYRFNVGAEVVDDWITSLVERGELFRFREDGRGWLTFNEELAFAKRSEWKQARKERISARKSEADSAELLDADWAGLVLGVFTNPGTHVQRMLTPKEIWMAAYGDSDSFTPDIGAKIRAVVRQLNRCGLMTYGTRGNKRGGMSKSASQEVFKAGLSSQEVKNMLQTRQQQDGGLRKTLEEIIRQNEKTIFEAR